MRPIQLKMTAFGPYKGTEVIDFRELKDNLLFVISGATGSGKTTIFDGICFALYGFASGEDRTDIRALRSHFAEDNVQTEVELTFEIKGRTYRIMRQVPYTKKGNKTETLANSTLYELTEEGEVSIVDRQIVSEINPKVEELIGFTLEQFNQIVMLPQGEFRKFLTSDTENKELIMRKIFKTDQYRTIVTKLKQGRDEAKAHLQSFQQQKQSIIEQVISSLPKRDSSLFSVFEQEHYNTIQVLDGLQEERLFYEEKMTADEKQAKKLSAEHDRVSSIFHQAKATNERFVELAQKEQYFRQLDAQVPELAEEKKQLDQADKAVSIEQIEFQLTELQAEYKRKEEELARSTKTLTVAQDQLEQVKVQHKVEEQKQPELEKLKGQLIRLEDALPKVKELNTKKDQLTSLKIKQKASEEQLADMQAQLIKEQAHIQDITKEIEEKDEAVLTLDEQVDLLTTVVSQCKLIDEYMALQEQSDKLAADEKEKEASYKEAKTTYETFTNQWIQGEAALLAAELQAGEACPVCGSVEHPQKAHEENSRISKEQLEQEKAHLERVESDYRMAKAHYESAQTQLEEKAESLLKEGIHVTDLVQEKEKITAKRKKLEKEVTALREMRQQLVQLRKSLDTQTKKINHLNEQHFSLERTLLETKAYIQTTDALVQQIIETVPEDLRELSALEQKIKDIQNEKNHIEFMWQQIQKKLEECREQLTAATSNQKHAESSLGDVGDKKEQAEKRFAEALKTSMFETKEAYDQAKMTNEKREHLRKKINDFKQEYYAVRQNILELQEVLKGKEQVDLASLEEQLVQLRTFYEQALQTFNQSRHYYESVAKLIEQLNLLVASIQHAEQKFGKIEDLYDIIRGQNHMKLSFERYIQIEYLEQMIQSANERLREMSNGQFELIRSDRQEVRGRQSGLGLDVYDAYTGQTRDVKTLSGGEKFNAALCLALGMSDIIQSFQGAVSIDTMFIDEGFGTLDEESLAKAIDTLIDLQKAGRMIGVISHVEELKAALPAILEVKKEREGYSRTSFILK